MNEFKEFLVKSGEVSQKTLPYYIRWVESAYKINELSLESPLRDDLAAEFLRKLALDHEDWQVRQALEALSIYRYYLGGRNKNSEETERGDHTCQANPNIA